MTARFAWADGELGLGLSLTRGITPDDVIRALAGPSPRFGTPDDYYIDDEHYPLAVGRAGNWTYTFDFRAGQLLSGPPTDLITLSDTLVVFAFTDEADNAFYYYRDGQLVRACEPVTYHAMELEQGEPLLEERGLFQLDSAWDGRSDGLELVARLTGTHPSPEWWNQPGATHIVLPLF